MRILHTVLPAAALVLVAHAIATPARAQNNQPAPGGGDQINEEEYSKDSNTEINVKNADIAAIVRIFSRKTKRNYILDEKVRGKVSIYLPGKVSAEESLRILDSVLALKGFTSVPIGENLWKIVPSREARQSTIPTLTEQRTEKPTAAVVTRLVNLKYVSAEDVQQIVSQLISADGLVNAYTGTNSLILIDAEDNINRLVSIIEELDVPFSNREMTIIPVKFADVEDVAQKLSDILGTSGSESKRAPSPLEQIRASMGDPSLAMGNQMGGMPGQPQRPQGAGASSKTVAARGMEPKIIPDQRTNSIIVVADGDTTARVRALIAQLDSKVDLSGNKFYVYRCQHANAEEIAQVLAGLVGGGGGAGGGAAGGFGAAGRGTGAGGGLGGVFGDDSGGAFGGSRNNQLQNRNRGSSSFGGSGSSSAGGGLGGGGLGGSRGGRGGARGGQAGPTTAQLGENISITADPATNSLIIAAGKSDYEKIRGLLAQLDVKRRQVLVEATLLEVSIDDTLSTSMSFLTSTGGADGGAIARSEFAPDSGSLNSLFNDPSKLQGFTLAAASAGSLKLPGITLPTQSLIVSAAQRNNNVNILSAPTILATDNEEAQIVVGQNVPFLASTSTNATNLNNTFNQVERQDVGITLRITPQISSRDYVTLRVFTEVSALDLATVNSTLGPTTRKRQSETTIIAKDSQMIVTGGLIADDVTEADEGVPYLKDVPVLGHAFKSNSTARQQKNLLIFLTPRIIKDQFDARDATIESREQMEDVIASYDVRPSRNTVLEHKRIDAVAESTQYDGPAPGTILAPERKKTESTAKDAAPVPPSAEEPIILDGSKEGTLELDVKPALPKSDDVALELGQSDQALNEQPRSMASLSEKSLVTGPTASTDSFIVVEVIDPNGSTTELPFLLGNPGATAGIIVPRDSSLEAKGFFRAGQVYTYTWNGQQVRVRSRALYPSIQDAQASNPDLPAAWYTLSPYEIMNLGRGPWLKGE